MKPKKPTSRIAEQRTATKKAAGKVVSLDSVAKMKPIPNATPRAAAKMKPIPNATSGTARSVEKPKSLPYKKYADPLSDAITREFAPATAKKPKKKK